jgi:hypothetical protein
MDQVMKESTLEEKNRVAENTSGQMVVTMKVNGMKTKFTVRVNIIGRLGIIIMVQILNLIF